MAHRYLRDRSSGAFGMLFNDSTANVSRVVFDTMSARQQSALASKRQCRITTTPDSSRGTVSSATSGSASRSAVSNARPTMKQFVDPFGVGVHRSSMKSLMDNVEEVLEWDDSCAPPEMSESDAVKVKGGFMASGRAKDIVEAVERELRQRRAKVI